MSHLGDRVIGYVYSLLGSVSTKDEWLNAFYSLRASSFAQRRQKAFLGNKKSVKTLAKGPLCLLFNATTRPKLTIISPRLCNFCV